MPLVEVYHQGPTCGRWCGDLFWPSRVRLHREVSEQCLAELRENPRTRVRVIHDNAQPEAAAADAGEPAPAAKPKSAPRHDRKRRRGRR